MRYALAARQDVHHHHCEMLPLFKARAARPPDDLRCAPGGMVRENKNPVFADKAGRQMIDECVKNFGTNSILNHLEARWVGYLVGHHKANIEVRLHHSGELMRTLERVVDSLEAGIARMLLAPGANPKAHVDQQCASHLPSARRMNNQPRSDPVGGVPQAALLGPIFRQIGIDLFQQLIRVLIRQVTSAPIRFEFIFQHLERE